MPTNTILLLAFLGCSSENSIPSPVSGKPTTAPSSSVSVPSPASAALTPARSAPVTPSFGMPPDSKTTFNGQGTTVEPVATAGAPTASPPQPPAPAAVEKVEKAVPAPTIAVQKAPTVPDANPPKSKTVRTHRIARGETLTGIAWAHGIAVEDLLRWNSLTWVDTYRTGQTITLEPLTAGWRVRPGQNLGQIALVCHVGVDELASLNHLSADYVRSGTVLDIPSTVAVR